MTAPLKPASAHPVDAPRAVMWRLYDLMREARAEVGHLAPEEAEAELLAELPTADIDLAPEAAVRKAARYLELAKRAVAMHPGGQALADDAAARLAAIGRAIGGAP